MKKIIAIELSLLALESYDFEAFVDEINEIVGCIEMDRKYEDAPNLSSSDLSLILDNMTKRQGILATENTVWTSIDTYPELRKRIRKIILNRMPQSNYSN